MKLHGMSQTVGFFASIGLGAFWAYLVSIIEVVGGILLIAGYLIQIAGTLLAVVMTVAIIRVTGPIGFEMSFTPLLLGIGALTVAISGCGKYSICNMFHRKNCTTCEDSGKCGCQH
jgi:putative oxidoreductase